MANRKAPSLTRLKEILRESAFDPRSEGPNSIIVETVLVNPGYGENRAIELLREAQKAINSPSTNPRQATENAENYHRLMAQAMGLLALTIAVRD